MKKFAALVTGCILSLNISQAEVLDLPVNCGNTEQVLITLKEKYQEQIVWMATGDGLNNNTLFYTLWINPQNPSWTYIVTNKEKETSCLISSGTVYQTFTLDSI